MAATVYMIKLNGITQDKTYTNKGRAMGAAELFAKSADGLGMGDTVEIVTQKTGKIVFTYTAASVITEANKITADKDAHTMRLSEFQALEDAYIREGVVTLSEVLTAQYAAEEALSVSVVGVIQNGTGMAGITHYHTPGCRDIQREMKRYGQSAGDVLCMNFESVAEILIMEMGDVSSDYASEGTPEWYEAILENSNSMVRIMPCLSIPEGKMGDRLLRVVKGEVFSLEQAAALDPQKCVRCGVHGDMSMTPENTSEGHVCGFCTAMAQDAEENSVQWVTQEYLLEIVVDESTGAAVDLGWHKFTVSAANAANAEVIANMYGVRNGSGMPRDGWVSIIRVIDVCDV